MKTLNRSFFWVILITLVAAFSACDLNPNVVDPDPEQTVVKDSVVIEVTFVAPAGTVFSETALLLRNSAIPNGGVDQYYRYRDVRTFFRFVFYDEVARAMIGTQCELIPTLAGQINGESHGFFPMGANFKATVQKVTKVTIDVE